MKSTATTVQDYIDQLPEDRRKAIEAVRKVILENLPAGYEESMQYGMIVYVVPLHLYPEGYLDNPKQPLSYAALASQKNYMSLYLMNIYGDEASANWFEKEYKASGKKLDMGKSCVRFKKLEDLPLALVGKAIGSTPVAAYIRQYESSRATSKTKKLH